MIFSNDLEKMVPQQAQRWIIWDRTKKEQWARPRHIVVSMWFKHETNMIVMVD